VKGLRDEPNRQRIQAAKRRKKAAQRAQRKAQSMLSLLKPTNFTDETSAEDVFYNTDDLFVGIGLALKNSEVNTIFVEAKDTGNTIFLSGPNPKSKTCVKLVCAQETQLEAVKENYRDRLVNLVGRSKGSLRAFVRIRPG
jgi:hypothetical protein